jgi:hypothetical protein
MIMLFPPFFAYAETHFSFLPGFSLVSRRFPEILVDAPRRINPGVPLPFLLIVKDAHRFPITVTKVEIAGFEPSAGCILKNSYEDKPFPINEPFFSRMYKIDLSGFTGKTVFLNAKIDFLRKGKSYTLLNDNFPQLSHKQMRVFVASSPLPASQGWVYGDAHVHTLYSSSHVEFGATVFNTAVMAKSLGLSFLVCTDHSYDLMCKADNYLQMDSACSQWEKQRKEIRSLNLENFLTLQGEEISCANHKKQNVHMISIGNRDFVKGSGDGARRIWNKHPEHTVPQATELVHKSGGICFSAHPYVSLGLPERLALNRGNWGKPDFDADVNGMQFWNGWRSAGFYKGRKKWVEFLLQGKKFVLMAGSDSHGDGNGSRKLLIPFFLLDENENLFLGSARTCVFCPTFTESGLLESLKQGKSVITDGPFLSLQKAEDQLVRTALSSEEFGALCRLKIFSGKIGETRECIISEQVWEPADRKFSDTGRIPLTGDFSYVRGELTSRLGEKEFFCMTNPVWI